ncbi:MAG: TRAP transporter substrate-binding protein [Rhodocyclaceae bacterium]|nr:TRAP transporter substrate-binding protein [Rhodocyclaceae bacterium]
MNIKQLLAACALLTGSALAFAQQAPIIIKFSHVASADAPKGKAAERFKKLAEEATKGRVKVELYPNSQLYKDKEEMEALQLGAVQMLAPAPGKFGPLGVKEFEVLDLPYLFDNMEMAQKVTHGPIGQLLLKKLDARGITGLTFWDNGFRVFTSNKPIHRPTDLKGQKIRIQSSKVTEAQMRDVSAIPQVLAFGELYQALQTGVVDGQENPVTHVWTQKFYEVQKYMTLTNHTYHGYVVIANKKFWDNLPEDIRAALNGALKDTSSYFYTMAKAEDDAAMESLRKSGRISIYTPTLAEMVEWKKAFIKVHREMEGRVGKDLIEAIYKETGADPKKL